MKIIILYDVRGLGVAKKKEVQNFVRDRGPNILRIQETKLEMIEDFLLKKKDDRRFYCYVVNGNLVKGSNCIFIALISKVICPLEVVRFSTHFIS